MKRRAEDVIPGPRSLYDGPSSPADGHRVRVWTPGRLSPASVYIVAGRVVWRGTAAELQRLVGLSEAAFAAYAVGRGWRLGTAEVSS